MKKIVIVFVVFAALLGTISSVNATCETYGPAQWKSANGMTGDIILSNELTEELISDIVVSDQGQQVIAGSIENFAVFGSDTFYNVNYGGWPPSTDAYVASYDVDGSLLFAKHISQTDYSSGENMTVDKIQLNDNGSIILYGQFPDLWEVGEDTVGSYDTSVPWLNNGVTARAIVLDSLGEFVTHLVNVPHDFDELLSLDGEYFEVGRFEGQKSFGGLISLSAGSPRYNGYLAKYGLHGAGNWALRMYSTGCTRATDVAVDADGNIFVAGNFQGDLFLDGGTAVPVATGMDDGIFIAKYSSSGLLLWSDAFDVAFYDYGSNSECYDDYGEPKPFLDLTPDGDVRLAFELSYFAVINGQTVLSSGPEAPCVISYDAEGAYEQHKVLDGFGSTYLIGMEVDEVGNTVLVTQTWNLVVDEQVLSGPTDRIEVISLDLDLNYGWSLASSQEATTYGVVDLRGDYVAIGGGYLDQITFGQTTLPGSGSLCCSRVAGYSAVVQLPQGTESPAEIEAIDITSTSANLTWILVSDAVAYEIRGAEVGSSQPITLTVGGAQTEKSVHVLQPSTSYWWQMRSLCDPGTGTGGPWSDIDTFTTACVAPQFVATSGVTGTTAVLNWSTVQGATGYQVSGRPVGGQWQSFRVYAGSVSSTPVAGLQPNTMYEWRVRALCSGISDYSSLDFFVTGSGSSKNVNYSFAPAHEIQLEISLTPNPASSFVDVEVSNFTGSTIELLSVGGSVVRTVRITEGIARIPLEGMSNGVYLVRAIDDKRVQTHKLIIAH